MTGEPISAEVSRLVELDTRISRGWMIGMWAVWCIGVVMLTANQPLLRLALGEEASPGMVRGLGAFARIASLIVCMTPSITQHFLYGRGIVSKDSYRVMSALNLVVIGWFGGASAAVMGN